MINLAAAMVALSRIPDNTPPADVPYPDSATDPDRQVIPLTPGEGSVIPLTTPGMADVPFRPVGVEVPAPWIAPLPWNPFTEAPKTIHDLLQIPPVLEALRVPLEHANREERRALAKRLRRSLTRGQRGALGIK